VSTLVPFDFLDHRLYPIHSLNHKHKTSLRRRLPLPMLLRDHLPLQSPFHLPLHPSPLSNSIPLLRRHRTRPSEHCRDGEFGCRLDLKTIALQARNTEYNLKVGIDHSLMRTTSNSQITHFWIHWLFHTVCLVRVFSVLQLLSCIFGIISWHWLMGHISYSIHYQFLLWLRVWTGEMSCGVTANTIWHCSDHQTTLLHLLSMVKTQILETSLAWGVLWTGMTIQSCSQQHWTPASEMWMPFSMCLIISIGYQSPMMIPMVLAGCSWSLCMKLRCWSLWTSWQTSLAGTKRWVLSISHRLLSTELHDAT